MMVRSPRTLVQRRRVERAWVSQTKVFSCPGKVVMRTEKERSEVRRLRSIVCVGSRDSVRGTDVFSG